jgi:hypothetical protein
MRAGYLCGLQSNIALCLQPGGASWDHKSSQKSTVWVSTCFSATFDLMFLHTHTCNGSGYETECVWCTCVDMCPKYLHVWNCGAEVEIIKASKCRLCGYKRAFLRLLTFCFFTNTHAMVVVMRQNVCGVSVWTWFRDTAIFADSGRKLRASKHRKVDRECIIRHFCDVWPPISSQIHIGR